MKKRILAFLLAVLMLMGTVPLNAQAAAKPAPGYNQEVLGRLTELLGSESEAKAYYDTLRAYGIFDENGNLLDSREVTLDGKAVTTGELREIVSGEYDENKTVLVDGKPVTLKDIAVILAIEDYINSLKGYIAEEGTLSPEQQAALESLRGQLGKEGLNLLRTVNPAFSGDFSGMNHGAAVSCTYQCTTGTAAVTFALSGAAEGQRVSFDYRTFSGSAKVTEEKKSLTLTAGEYGTAKETVNIPYAATRDDDIFSAFDTAFFIMADNIKNALFAETFSDSAVFTVLTGKTIGEGTAVSGSLYTSIEYPQQGLLNGNHVQVHLLSESEKATLNSGILSDIFINSYTELLSDQEILASLLDGAKLDYAIYFTAKTSGFDSVLTSTEGFQKILSGSLCYPDKTDNIIETAHINLNGHVNAIVFVTEAENLYNQYTGDEFEQAIGITLLPPRISRPSAFRIPAGTYHAGQTIPITVSYTAPAQSANSTITVNGQTLTPSPMGAEQEESNCLTYLYTVPEEDKLTLTVSSALTFCGERNATHAEKTNPNYTPEDVHIDCYTKKGNVEGITCSVDNTNPAAPVLKVRVPISANPKSTQLLLDDFDGKGVSESFSVGVSGAEKTVPLKLESDYVTGGAMVAEVPLKPSGKERRVTAELYCDGTLMVGGLAAAQLPACALVTAEDISAGVVVKSAAGGAYPYEDAQNPVIFVQEKPQIKASFSLAQGKTFAFGDITKVGVRESGKPDPTGVDFVWQSSDSSVAVIAADGTVTPTGEAGTVYFTLTALNGGSGEEAAAKTEAITLGAGKTPFLYIPNKNIAVVSGNSASVYWSSNIMDKPAGTKFNIEVRKNGAVVYTTTSKTGGAVIPASVLTYDYTGGTNNCYTVKVSTKYLFKNYADTATVTVESKPACITLNPLASDYLLDTAGKVHLSWKIENFDLWSADSSALFKLLITRGSETVYESCDNPGKSTASGVYSGSFDISIADIKADKENPYSYRDVYTVSIQAKNGSDSTWSYDSFIFYVYDNDALKIWLNGEEAGSSAALSNIPAISAMTQDEILALKRDIALKKIISANYGDFAWAEFSDKLSWSTSDYGVASLNYEQAGYYDYIENYSYTGYRPTEELMLFGEKDGEATITLTHSLSGMNTSLAVKVSTLKDKLYLFKLFPGVETTLTYTNGKGVEKTVKSDGKGEAAIYEESGIASDVYCTAKSGGSLYCGYLRAESLKTGEGNPRELALYPCNNLYLRKAAFAYTYLKNPDGTPYTGDIIFRGGVYINGSYCENALFSFDEDKAAKKSGSEDNRISLGDNGRLTVMMDVTQWQLENDTIFSGDKVEYRFLITKCDDETCYPLYLRINANLNEDEYVRTGGGIAAFRPNEKGKKNPFVASLSETLRSFTPNHEEEIDLAGHTGTVGISDFTDELDLRADVLWWSDSGDYTGCSAKLLSEKCGELFPDTVETRTEALPFTDYCITTYKTTAAKDTVGDVLDFQESTPLRVELYLSDGSLYRSEKLDFSFINLTDALSKNNKAMADMISNSDNFIAANPIARDLKTGDKFADYVIEHCIDDKYTEKNSGLFSLSLIPTKDPTIIIGHLTAGLASMRDANVTGAYADGTSDSRFAYYPGLRELQLLFSGSPTKGNDYVRKLNDEFWKAYKSQCLIDPEYIIRGYIQVLFRALPDGSWESYVLEGGFNVGGGVSAKWLFNEMVGPVPITAELKIGGTVEISMKALTTEYLNLTKGAQESGTEFLTNLRIFLYAKLFGGLGFDFSLIAAKIGAFGQLNFDFNFDWLNRPYLEEHDGERIVPGASPEAVVTDKNLDGRKISIYGQAGFEVFFKLWIFSYEKIIASWPFNLVDKPYGDWKEIEDLWKKNHENFLKDINDLLGTEGDVSTASLGSPYNSVDLAPTLDGFDYLEENGAHQWNKSTLKKSVFSFLGTKSGETEVLQSNAYPFAAPALSDDGSLMVYLGESENEHGMASRVSYAVRTAKGYTDKGVISNEGLGDASHSVAGTGRFAVSAWTRVTQDIEKDAGSAVTPEEQMIMLDSSEIYASVYNGEAWSTVKLTDNSSADIAPVVAVSGSKAIVAWRNVATNNVGGDISDFNGKDTILYKTCSNGVWSEEKSLYNGTSGNVKGLCAAMLADGTAAVSYILDTDSDSTTQEDREVLFGIIQPDSSVYRTIRATNDTVLDENPQITTAVFGGAQEEERFVLGWVSCPTANNDESGERELKLTDFGKDGILTGTLPQVLSKATSGTDITSDFRFSKNAGKAENLSVVWKEKAYTGEQSGGTAVGKDLLSAVKFYVRNSSPYMLGVTGKLPVTEMSGGTAIDSFDVIAGSDKAGVEAVILGTTYSEDETVTKEGETLAGEAITYTVPKSQSDIYTVRTEYKEGLSVASVYTDADALHCASDITVFFTVTNTGISPVTQAEAEIGGTKTAFANLNLLPGETMNLAADYTTPADTLENPDYTIRGTAGGEKIVCEGTANLAVPDLEIIKTDIIKESDGIRTVSVMLNNHSDAKLAKNKDTVEIRFYSDSEYEHELADMEPVIISDKTSLQTIDEGGCSVQQDFDIQSYLTSRGTKEIPQNGLRVYIKASVMRKNPDTDKNEAVAEAVTSNNTSLVKCENLMLRTGEAVSVGTEITNTVSGSEVLVKVRNNTLSKRTSGNIIVTLFDKAGNILGQKQSYNSASPNSGLVTLGGEETARVTFTFDKKCAYARADYTDMVLDDSANARLAQFHAVDIPGAVLGAFVEDPANPGTYRLSINEEEAQSTAVLVAAQSPSARITLNGEPVSGSTRLTFPEGINAFDFTVTSGDGTAECHYIFTVSKPDLMRKEAIAAAKQAIDAAVNGDTAENVTAAAAYAKEAIEAAQTLEDIETAKNNGLDAVKAAKALNAAKAAAIEELNGKKAEVKSQKAKDAAERAVDAIEAVTAINRIAPIKEKALREMEQTEQALVEAKASAVSQLKEKAGERPSEPLHAVLKEAYGAIDAAESVETVNALLAEYLAKADYQLKKDGFTMQDTYCRLGFRDTYALTASSATGDAIVYTSSDNRVATVDENGVIHAKRSGTAVIVARIEGTDITKKCKVKVSYTLWDILFWAVRLILNTVLWPLRALLMKQP